MRYPKEFYEELKADWEKSREELQQRRKAIDDKRNEFYSKYYIIKNGINDLANPSDMSGDSATEGTRPKQNRERKIERDKIDNRTKTIRDNADFMQESWSEHYKNVAKPRIYNDAKKIAKFNKMLADLERVWEEYKDLVNKYHMEYYAIENPAKRQREDQQVYDASVHEKANYQKEFESQIEQDRLFADEAWERMAQLHAASDNAIKKQREDVDKNLMLQRKKQRQDNQDYNLNYYPRMAEQRNKTDVKIIENRKNDAESLQKYRKRMDEYYSNNNSWRKYRENSQKNRAEQNTADAMYFSEWFANLKDRISSYWPWVYESFKSGMSLVAKTNADQIKNLSIAQNVKSIRNWIYTTIKDYNAASDKYLNDWFKSIPDMYTQAKKSYNEDLQEINKQYMESLNNTAAISDAVGLILKNHSAARDKVLKERKDYDDELRQSRSEWFANYDSYIKNFFKTRRESRAQQLSQRAINRANADAERAAAREKKLYNIKDHYSAELAEQRIELFNKYTQDIKTLKDNGLTGYARNKYIAMSVRKGWFAFVDALFNSGVFMANGIIKFGYISQDIAIYALRAGISFGSFAYYAIGSSAYVVHVVDRYIIRNMAFLSYDLLKLLARNSRDFFDYSFLGLRVAARAVGLALYKIPLFYALRRTLNALGFAIRVVGLPISYLAARIVNFTFKCIYFPAVALLGTTGELLLRITHAAVMIFIGLKFLLETAGVSLFHGIGGAILLSSIPIRFGFFVMAKTLTLGYRFVSRPIMDSAYLIYVISHNIITAVSRLMYDGGVLLINLTGDILRYVGRKLEDVGQDVNQHLYQNILLPMLQTMQDSFVYVSRKATDTVTNISRAIGSFMFACYVGAYTLKTRISYTLGFASADAIYYGGRLVTHASRFANDRYQGVGSVLNNHFTPVAAGVHKGAKKAAFVAENIAIITARAADDYVCYPVTYAYKYASVGAGRRLWDGSVNVWRGLQDMCTYGIRGFHDFGHEVDKRVTTPLVKFGRIVEDKSTNAAQAVKYGAYKAHDTLQGLNIVYILEHGAEQALKDLAEKGETAAKTANDQDRNAAPSI